jgi:hypothetical protein
MSHMFNYMMKRITNLLYEYDYYFIDYYGIKEWIMYSGLTHTIFYVVLCYSIFYQPLFSFYIIHEHCNGAHKALTIT